MNITTPALLIDYDSLEGLDPILVDMAVRSATETALAEKCPVVIQLVCDEICCYQFGPEDEAPFMADPEADFTIHELTGEQAA